VQPFFMLDDFLGEPLLLTRDFNDELHCMSNVCTHRGTLVAECAGNQKNLRCRYHGRRFALNGDFEHMPEFEGVACFDPKKESLPKVAMGQFRQFLFASLQPAQPFADLIAEMERRLAWLSFQDLSFDAATSREYLVNAHWALYVDNYLEGFHLPYVHAGLSKIIDYGSYATELFPAGVLQIGFAKPGEQAFEVPASSPDHGKRVGAYYYWLFPNTMFSIYPWGVSVNVIKPVSVKKTRVVYMNYLWDREYFESSGWPTMDRVEREDEEIVESIQRGMRSTMYRRGRFSPTREAGVHRFHRLLSAALGL
jgi:choline monooxygenase